MKPAFLTAYALMAFGLFRRFPSDEALVRSVILALTFTLVYGVVQLVRWLLHIGR